MTLPNELHNTTVPEVSDRPKVPALIDDYRTHREAWRAQARDLVRLRGQVLAAAEREARDIVETARAEVREVLVKARRELLVLAAQVKAAGDTGEAEGIDLRMRTNGLEIGGDDELRSARHVLSARRDVRWILTEAKPDFEALSRESVALRTGLMEKQVQARTTSPADVPRPPEPAFSSVEPFISYAQPRVRPRLRIFAIASVVVGLPILLASVWWLRPAAGGDEAPRSAIPATSITLPTPGPSEGRAAGPAAAAHSPDVPAMTIEARRLVWMRTTVDGYVVTARLFQPGETQQVIDARDVSIRAGDAGAVFVSVKGATATALGRDGEVVTRRFVLDAPLSPDVSPPAEPTSTSTPGPTEDRSQVSTQKDAATARSGPESPDSASREAQTASVAPSTSAPRPPVSPGVVSPSRESASAPPLRDSIMTAAGHWLDAYYRQDAAAMKAVSSGDVDVTDERADNERLPRGMIGVRRTLGDVGLQVFGENALLTARMTERADDLPRGRTILTTSFVSQMWAHRTGRWELDNVRIVGAEALARMGR